jgi:hypothetical protein
MNPAIFTPFIREGLGNHKEWEKALLRCSRDSAKSIRRLMPDTDSFRDAGSSDEAVLES